MGLYDEVIIDINVSDWIPNFPIPDDELKELLYQTKCLDCLLDVYGIRSDNMFVDLGNGFRNQDELREITPDTKLVFTRYKLHDDSTLTLPFSGTVNFYTWDQTHSLIEFLAVFKNARLESFHCTILEKKPE